MKPTRVFCPLLITLSNAQLNPRAENMLKELEMPSELESLIESVELKASSVIDNIHSAYSHAATAVPTDILKDVGGLLPTQTPASDAAVDVAMSYKAPCFALTLGLAVVAVEFVCPG
ncbi:hypothetical protein T440DRAFT_521205 [Plenodomus tracheiphilus IPT5]|uniref:Uncharacterized protein n=1 Tax=Plenodomus tracheiphilus IPT5 TaxID=1408161 RepID=A0A6A7AV81_9PLEO|nr:hypothetical protein T440DRAFT_521205 [Plenodomus tracheiphilus IPT5]